MKPKLHPPGLRADPADDVNTTKDLELGRTYTFSQLSEVGNGDGNGDNSMEDWKSFVLRKKSYPAVPTFNKCKGRCTESVEGTFCGASEGRQACQFQASD